MIWAAWAVALSGCAAPGPAGETGGRSRGSGPPWTIRCIELQGPNRLQLIEQFADTLRQTPGIRADEVFYRDEDDGYARLYYGRYGWNTDRAGGEPMPRQMRADLDLLKQLGDPTRGQRYFVQSLPVRMPQPDAGDPRWRLEDAPGKYSLQVAVFEPAGDFWQFKKAAAEHCADLREQGFEAYYHHSPASSVVTVGSFGPEAVVTQFDGTRYSTVYSPEVRALQENELLAHNLLNGRVYYAVDEDGNRVPMPSRLVEIPR